VQYIKEVVEAKKAEKLLKSITLEYNFILEQLNEKLEKLYLEQSRRSQIR